MVIVFSTKHHSVYVYCTLIFYLPNDNNDVVFQRIYLFVVLVLPMEKVLTKCFTSEVEYASIQL